MNETESESNYRVVVENVHLCSLKVTQPLTSGSAQLDQLLLWFAEKLLTDLFRPKAGLPDRLDLNRPHVLIIGFPYEEDVSACTPRFLFYLISIVSGVEFKFLSLCLLRDSSPLYFIIFLVLFSVP